MNEQEADKEMTTGKAKSIHYPLIPKEERKCIWMLIGFISYKLCDRDYQCEQCCFDQAMKNGASVEGHGGKASHYEREGSLTDSSLLQMNAETIIKTRY